jgi:LysM repeat protein
MKIKTIRLKTRHRRNGRATSLWNILTGKWGRNHRLPAHVTGESDWEVEVPQIRMSRAFAVMLVLHIVAVGGLFAFRIWGRDDEKKDTTLTDTADTSATSGTGIALVSSPQTSVSTEAPAPDEPLRTYTWHAGDTLQLVAARFNVSGSALRDANPGKELSPGIEIVVPRSGRIIGGSEVDTQANRAAEIYDPLATPKDTASTEPPAPKLEVVPELSGDAGIPDVIPSPAAETPAPKVQKVSTQVAGKTGTAQATTNKTTAAKKDAAKTAEPVLTKTKPKAIPVAEPVARTGGQRVHVVTKGDTVFNVAKRFGFTAAEIAKANGLGSDYRIQLGQQLRIPVKR